MADPKKLYVIDASVILKWHFYQEDDYIQALRIKNDFIEKKLFLTVPSHAFTETVNVLSIKKPDFAVTFLSQLFTLSIEEYPLSIELAARALAIMSELSRISFYDAVYHALAILLGGTFVTADKDYYKKAKSIGRVMLLKDYKSA